MWLRLTLRANEDVVIQDQCFPLSIGRRSRIVLSLWTAAWSGSALPLLRKKIRHAVFNVVFELRQTIVRIVERGRLRSASLALSRRHIPFARVIR